MFFSVCFVHSDRLYCILNFLSVSYKTLLVLYQRVYIFLMLCCSFRFSCSLTNLLNIHKPAPIPLVTGTRTNPIPVTLKVSQADVTLNTKTRRPLSTGLLSAKNVSHQRGFVPTSSCRPGRRTTN